MSNKAIIEDYFEASLKMDAEAMAKHFAEDIEIQNITPEVTSYIYGINQFKRSCGDEAAKIAQEIMNIFEESKKEIKSINEKGKSVELKIAFEGKVTKDLGANAPYKVGDVVKNESRSVFEFNNDGKICLIKNYLEFNQ